MSVKGQTIGKMSTEYLKTFLLSFHFFINSDYIVMLYFPLLRKAPKEVFVRNSIILFAK